MRDVQVSEELLSYMSKRAAEQIAEVRVEFPWVEPGHTANVRQATGKLEWWTFGGAQVSATFAGGLAKSVGPPAMVQNLALTLENEVTIGNLTDAIDELKRSIGVAADH